MTEKKIMKCSLCKTPAAFIAVDFAPYGIGPKGKYFYYKCPKCGAETRHIYGNNEWPTVTGKLFTEEAAREDAAKQTEFCMKGKRP